MSTNFNISLSRLLYFSGFVVSIDLLNNLTSLRHPQTPYEHPQIPSRFPPDSSKTPSRQFQDTLRHPSDTTRHPSDTPQTPKHPRDTPHAPQTPLDLQPTKQPPEVPQTWLRHICEVHLHFPSSHSLVNDLLATEPPSVQVVGGASGSVKLSP